MAGDETSVAKDGVRVNGVWLRHSKLLTVDKAGMLPCYSHELYTLDALDALLMSQVSESAFDACYFGPVNRSKIVAVILPVLTWWGWGVDFELHSWTVFTESQIRSVAGFLIFQ